MMVNAAETWIVVPAFVDSQRNCVRPIPNRARQRPIAVPAWNVLAKCAFPALDRIRRNVVSTATRAPTIVNAASILNVLAVRVGRTMTVVATSRANRALIRLIAVTDMNVTASPTAVLWTLDRATPFAVLEMPAALLIANAAAP
jgi:hypothetical protein